MNESDIDETTLRDLTALRNGLLFILSDQFPPPDPAAAELWVAYNALQRAVDELKGLGNFSEPIGEVGWTTDPGELA
ncbi:MAG TPA: hypothetical protein VF655_03575 [Allosphingosinicella sp.]|jgi:hypothetical protein